MPNQNEKSSVVDYVFPLLKQMATTGLASDRLKAIELMLSHAEHQDRNDLVARIEALADRLDARSDTDQIAFYQEQTARLKSISEVGRKSNGAS